MDEFRESIYDDIRDKTGLGKPVFIPMSILKELQKKPQVEEHDTGSIEVGNYTIKLHMTADTCMIKLRENLADGTALVGQWSGRIEDLPHKVKEIKDVLIDYVPPHPAPIYVQEHYEPEPKYLVRLNGTDISVPVPLSQARNYAKGVSSFKKGVVEITIKGKTQEKYIRGVKQHGM